MQKTKTKIVKSISILSKSPLYGAVLVLAGCDWFGRKKKITAIRYDQIACKPIYTETHAYTPDEAIIQSGLDNPGFTDSATDENNNLLGHENLEKASTEQKQRDNMPPKAALEEDNKKTNQTPIPEENDGLESNENSQEPTIDASGDDDKKRDPIPEDHDTHSNTIQNDGIVKMKTPPKKYQLEDLNQRVTELEAKVQEIKDKKIKIDKQTKKTLIQGIKPFLREHKDILKQIGSRSEEDQQEYIQAALDVANRYIKEIAKNTVTK